MSLSQVFKQPLDRIAIITISVLTVLIGVLLWSGDSTAPQIRDFSWQDKSIQADDVAFTLTFNRPMNRDSVESNLKISPALPGKISWAGRRLAYTLNQPALYGKSYTIELKNAYDRFANEASNHTPIVPFIGKFTTPEPIFAYIGIEGEEAGRLLIYNLTTKQKRLLTPADLVVSDFRIYPERDKILFAASPKSSQPKKVRTFQPLNSVDDKLYTVKLDGKNTQPELQLILDSGEYQNLKFDLSPNGQNIVVQRLNRLVPGRYGLWIIKNSEAPKPLDNQPGGDFLIAPDSNSVAIAQGEGVAILPLQPQAQPLDFLPKFGTVLNFSKDGMQAATIKYNKDYTRSLYRVTNQGVQQELFKTGGSILSAVFDPQKQTLYCLLTDLQTTNGLYQEQPYLAAIDLQTAKLKRLLELPNQRNLKMSLAPDGSALLLDPTETNADTDSSRNSSSAKPRIVKPEFSQSGASPSQPQAERSDRNTITIDSQQSPTAPELATSIESTSLAPPKIKILPLLASANATETTLEDLQLPGLHPQWLP